MTPRHTRGRAVIDLRSDTVTRPDAEMRAAMAAAEVADDILDGDPTTRALEERGAEMLAVEAALWVPSGSMGNAIALAVHLRPGDRFVAPRLSHVVEYELGAVSWLTGALPRELPWSVRPGCIEAAVISRTVSSDRPYDALRDRLLCLENTHNAAGGTVTSPQEHREVVTAAREAGMLVHLDGARLWNAAVAAKTSLPKLTSGVDSVQVCLSKGLGAPMGSLVCGSADFVRQARRVRKMLGGAVRQSGVVAAAGLVALGRVDRLEEDHRKASLLAAGVRDLGWEVPEPETNIVMAKVPDADGLVRNLDRIGVGVTVLAGKVRMVTHCDLSEGDVRDALVRIKRLATFGEEA
ncbi:aminotransferase class I/II-fold pyridoxal phosphate-dependent enzyme [Streptomyces sp. PTM05]|uniref:Aminotransferase class I/II-fold pyridoxal phosphate-dependent enzyme n=1 Tax=Streptantibioticus parmotrematis TaxID=2873249 RepID=A0ABS7QVS7_9ACTN|nr:GntG family PLP-dependent aldolase [Streptantibioticus parmotrematis]MBY8887013.1 aminotransferase class I/II-fold pyridoxal phosphate-dependent enzyme [Streptantibioticus parmotrematis]